MIDCGREGGGNSDRLNGERVWGREKEMKEEEEKERRRKEGCNGRS